MSKKFSDLLARAVVAVIGAAIMIFAMVYNHWTYSAVFAIIMMLCVREFVRLATIPFPLQVWIFVAALSLHLMFFLNTHFDLDSSYFLILAPITFIGLVAQLFVKDETPLRTMGMQFLTLAYVVLPLNLLNFLAFVDNQFNPVYTLALLFMVWSMDTGAYLFGSAFGKNKLFEKISPKKTIEGAIGGIFLTLVASAFFGYYSGEMNMIKWLLAGLIVGITALFGDLIESYMKRVNEAKDSGHALPGHGGFLDRFDSMLFAIPFYLIYLKFFVG